MDTANLAAFVKVAESGSFSHAAQQLFVTQPAISKRIKQLEQFYGSKLIDRKGKNIHLTQTGESLLPRARQILQDMQIMHQHISDMEGSPMGALSMATSHHIGLHRLPPILRHFSVAFPDVNLDLSFMDSEQACELIEQGEMDIAVVTLPTTHSSKLEYTTIWVDDLIITCAREHPLTRLPHLQLQDLTQHPSVLPSHGTFTREAIETALSSVRDELDINLETNYLETIKMMVSVGLGWSILPHSMLDDSLHALTIPEFKSSRKLGFILNRHRTRSRALSVMLELLLNAR